MWPFKKKNDYKLYRVVWKYDSTNTASYTEFISAPDVAKAWALVKEGHGIPIHCDSIEEVEANGQRARGSIR